MLCEDSPPLHSDIARACYGGGVSATTPVPVPAQTGARAPRAGLLLLEHVGRSRPCGWRVVDDSAAVALCAHPQEAYTQQLLAATPELPREGAA